MNKLVAITKETYAKRDFSSTHVSGEGIHCVRDKPERQRGSFGSVIDDILVLDKRLLMLRKCRLHPNPISASQGTKYMLFHSPVFILVQTIPYNIQINSNELLASKFNNVSQNQSINHKNNNKIGGI